VEFWGDGTFQGQPIGARTIQSGVGAYDVIVPGGQPYFIRGFLDADGDGLLDANEAKGVYSPSGQGAEPVFTPLAGTVPGIDFTLRDPGASLIGGTGASGEGTASIAPAAAGRGALLASTTIQVVVGASGIQTLGRVGVAAVIDRWDFLRPESGLSA